MKTINIKGKEYVTVNERIKAFREMFKDYCLITEIVEHGDDFALMKASVIDDKGVIRATGYAREVIAKSPINKFAFLENCETSAIGRALGNFGIGIDEAVCTADELLIKMSQDFEKDSSAKKTARTKALKAGKELQAEKQPLEERYQNAVQYIKNNEKDFSPSVIDRINAVISDLFAADKIEQATELNTLMNEHVCLEEIPEFE